MQAAAKPKPAPPQKISTQVARGKVRHQIWKQQLNNRRNDSRIDNVHNSDKRYIIELLWAESVLRLCEQGFHLANTPSDGA